jgi:hypothetical protein
MNNLPRLPWALAGVVTVFAAGWALFGQEQQPEARGQRSEVRGQPAEAGGQTARGEAASSQPAESADPAAESQPAGQTAESSEAGVRLLQEARDNLIGKPLEAVLAEDVLIGGFGPGQKRFKATGRYVQGPNLKLRLEFAIKVGQTQGTLLEVCDGQILWTLQKVGDRPRITRREVRTILDAASQAGHIDDNLLTAELGLGGLPALLASIERHMVLEAPRQETIDGHTVHVIEGRWNDDFLKRFQPSSDDTEEAQVLPAHVPDRIQIYLDSEKYPRRIVYRKQPPGREFYVPLLTLDFQDFRINPPIDDSEFVFEPERGVFQEDITREYLDRLRPQ